MNAASYEPLDVWARHATEVLARMEVFARVRRDRACALVSVRHATPAGEDVIVGTFAEVGEILRQAKQQDVAAALERARRAPARTHAVAILHDMQYPAALIEVPR